MMQSLFGGSKHAFYRFATVLPIPQIPESAWVEYIARKFKFCGKFCGVLRRKRPFMGEKVQ